MKTVDLDLLIIGGGIAGLWTLNRAINAGYNAVLLEKTALGGGQSVRSQGIIHGGMKYTLKGTLAPSATALRDMPDRWRACLAGNGEIDLGAARVLSDAHYMWSRDTLGSKLTSFFASKAMSGRVDPVALKERPEVFRHRNFSGALYRLGELVLDVPTVISALAAGAAGCIFKMDAKALEYQPDEAGGIAEIDIPEHELTLRPAHILVTAGEGFEALAAPLRMTQQEMQRRPLHMVMAKHRSELPIYAHCITTGSRPLVTITTHVCRDGGQVWYFGGDLAETGVERDADAQIRFTQQVLNEVLPWVKLTEAQWATLRVNRAEPAQSSSALPDTAYARMFGNVIAAWPTKLALSPVLADKVLAILPPPAANPGRLEALASLPVAPVASPPWEAVF